MQQSIVISRVPYLLLVFLILFISNNIESVSAGSNEESKAWLNKNQKKADVITLPSGLQYKVLKQGTGTDHPDIDTTCSCHYEGKLIDGTKFDSSYDRGEPTKFAPNQVIKGWTEAMQLMVQGDKWELYIPSELAYGDGGSPPKIKGGDALIFVMEIIDIEFVCDPLHKHYKGCSLKEKSFITSTMHKFGFDIEELEAELDRLMDVLDHAGGEHSNDHVSQWIKARLSILDKLYHEAKRRDDEF